MCEIDTINDTELYIDWLDDFYIPATYLLTELGICRTVNFAEPEIFLKSQVDVGRIFQGTYDDREGVAPFENETQPFMTTSVNLGLDNIVFYNEEIGKFKENGIPPFYLIIHSPYEYPTKENQIFLMSGIDYVTFVVTPQLNTIDESMIDMEPQKY